MATLGLQRSKADEVAYFALAAGLLALAFALKSLLDGVETNRKLDTLLAAVGTTEGAVEVTPTVTSKPPTRPTT